MLEAVVTHGTGEMAQVAGYRVAGKTGTAQRAVNGGFDDEHHVAWFAGYLPLPDPRLVVVVSVENPESDFWASSVAAPAFARIASAAMAEIGMPPTEPVPETARGGTT
jgi:cell division protein FtsI/penicillin-binding protein 2